MTFENKLNQPYPMTNIEDANNTKERILLEATIMFAKKGVASVSIRDLARQVNIKPASIYNHFKSKEVLYDSVLDNIRKIYLLYFDRLEDGLKDAQSYADVLDCMFLEVRQVVNIFTYYGFCLIQVEQMRDRKAFEIYSDVFLRFSIDFIAKEFDQCIEKGWAREFDTNTAATTFMHSILSGIIMRAHEDSHHKIPYDVTEMFASLHALLYSIGCKEETTPS